MSVIVSKFTISTKKIVICSDQISKIFCPKYGSAIESSARGPCDLSPLTDAWLSSSRPNLSSTVVDTCTGEMSLSVPSSRCRIWISLTVTQVWLQPGQTKKQNPNREDSLVQQQPYQYTKEDGLTLSHQNKILPRTISRRMSLIFFDTIRRYSGKKMEQLNSVESNSIFEIIIQKYELVRWSLASLFGRRRRFEKKMSVLLWWFGKNLLPPNPSRTLWKQSHWSYVTGQCD